VLAAGGVIIMNSLPTTLNAEDAEEITKLLQEARKYLRDAVGMKIYLPNYGGASSRIAELLQKFGIDAG
jgi:hypothetical protein